VSETLSASHARNSAQIYLWQAKLGLLTSQQDVAHHSELAAPTQSVSIYCTNDWLPDLLYVVPPCRHVLHVSIREGHGFHFFDIYACSKYCFTTGDYYSADSSVLV
jgi:hypothetical protein